MKITQESEGKPMSKQGKRTKRVIEKRNLIPAFDAVTLEDYLGQMSLDGMHFSGFAKKGKLCFTRGDGASIQYKVVFVSEIVEKSTGEFLSHCEDNGLQFIDRLDNKDIFVFRVTPETAPDMLQEIGHRGRIRNIKMLFIYSGLFFVSLAISVLTGYLMYVRSISDWLVKAQAYYSHDFYIWGTKLLFAAAVCMCFAMGTLFVRYLTRGRRGKRKTDRLRAWKKMYALISVSLVLALLSGLVGLVGGVRHGYSIYEFDEVPAGTQTIDFSAEGDQTEFLSFRGEKTSLALSDHHTLIWSGSEITKNNQIIQKSYETETFVCSSAATAGKLFRHFQVEDAAGTWTLLTDSQCNYMAIDAGKYAKKDQKWYLLLQSDRVVYRIETFNMYCNEDIDGSITQLVQARN